jgi:hypothetical protein
MKCERPDGPDVSGESRFVNGASSGDSLGFDLPPGCLLWHSRHPWSCTFYSALTMTFGDQFRMVGGPAANGDTSTGWPTVLVGAQLSWAIHDESRYRTAI